MGLKDESWAIQKKTYTKWINSYLARVNLHITDIFEDLRDGKILVKLLEVLSGEMLQRPSKNSMRFHKLANVGIAIQFLRSNQGMPLENIGPEDIVDGNQTLTLGLVWTIILRFTIVEQTEMDANSGETYSLLQWCQNITKSYDGVNVKNFTTSWQDGLAFNALIHAHHPDLIDFSRLDSTDHRGNLSNAFSVAETLGIPKLLDEEDVDIEEPDRKVMQTYISMIYTTFTNTEKKAKEAILQQIDDSSTPFEATEMTTNEQKQPEGSPKTSADDQTQGKMKTLSSEVSEALKRALRQGKKIVRRSRLILIGHHGAGKTSLKRRLLDEGFVEEHIKTNSIDADPYEAKVEVTKTRKWQKRRVENELLYNIQIMVLSEMNPLFRKVPDMKPPSSNLSAEALLTKEEETQLQESTAKLSAVKEPEEKLPHGKSKEKPIETVTPKTLSAGDLDQNAIELFVWDFGGQTVFYNTHTAFLGPNCIYVIVNDMSKDPEPTLRKNHDGVLVKDLSCPQSTTEFLEYWASCILTFASGTKPPEEPSANKPPLQPPVILVGTHLDEVQDKYHHYDNIVKQLLNRHPTFSNHCDQSFMFSNKEPDDKILNNIRRRIEFLAEAQKYEVPLTWFKFLVQLSKLAEDEVPQKTFSQAHGIASQLGLKKNEMLNALEFFHIMGDVVFFNEGDLRDCIITQPEWLIDQIRKVITLSEFHQKEKRFLNDRQHWRNLDEAGILHYTVIENVWDGNELQMELLAIMKRFALLCEIHNMKKMRLPKGYVDYEGRKYLVPCLLPMKPVNEQKSFATSPNGPAPVHLTPEDGFIPIGLLSRLIAALANTDGWTLFGKVYKDAARFLPPGSNVEISIQQCRNSDKQSIMISGTEIDSENIGSSFYNAFQTIQEKLQSTRSTLCHTKKFQLEIQCNACHDHHIFNATMNQVFCQNVEPMRCIDLAPYRPWIEEGSSEAFSLTGPPLWSSKHPEADEFVLDCPDIMKKLNEALPRIRAALKLDSIWAHLISRDVMTEEEAENCQVQKTSYKQSEEIVRFLKRDVMWKFHAMLRILAETKQEPLIDVILGKDAKELYNKDL